MNHTHVTAASFPCHQTLWFYLKLFHPELMDWDWKHRKCLQVSLIWSSSSPFRWLTRWLYISLQTTALTWITSDCVALSVLKGSVDFYWDLRWGAAATWPNGYGVWLRIRRSRVRVPSWLNEGVLLGTASSEVVLGSLLNLLYQLSFVSWSSLFEVQAIILWQPWDTHTQAWFKNSLL